MTSSTGYDWAKPGVKVVCVDDRSNVYCLPSHRYDPEGILVVKDQIYEIEAMGFHPDGQLCIVPKGVLKRGARDWGYNIKRFRPLIEKKLPQSLTCLLKNPKSVILPNEGQRWDTREKVQ